MGAVDRQRQLHPIVRQGKYMRFSRRTLAELARSLANVRAKEEIRNLAYEFNLENKISGTTLKELAGSLVRSAEHLRPKEKAEEAILRFIEYTFKHTFINSEAPLARSLKIDGFEWNGSKLIPTTPQPATLGREISTLEARLDELGFNVAKRHYEQSYASFVDGRWEACNGQLRSFMEDFLIQLENYRSGRLRTDPKAALDDLRGNLLNDKEWNLGRSIWAILHESGAHAGISDYDEALFRMHITTSFAHYLLKKIS